MICDASACQILSGRGPRGLKVCGNRSHHSLMTRRPLSRLPDLTLIKTAAPALSAHSARASTRSHAGVVRACETLDNLDQAGSLGFRHGIEALVGHADAITFRGDRDSTGKGKPSEWELCCSLATQKGK